MTLRRERRQGSRTRYRGSSWEGRGGTFPWRTAAPVLRFPRNPWRLAKTSSEPRQSAHDSQTGSRGRLRASGVARVRPGGRAWTRARAHGRGHARREDGARLALRGDPSRPRGRGSGRAVCRDPGGRPRRPQPRDGDRAALPERTPAGRGVHVQREYRPAPAGREPGVAHPQPGAHRGAHLRGRARTSAPARAPIPAPAAGRATQACPLRPPDPRSGHRFRTIAGRRHRLFPCGRRAVVARRLLLRRRGHGHGGLRRHFATALRNREQDDGHRVDPRLDGCSSG